MEVLSKLGIDWKLLLAQIVNFLILLFVLRHFAYRPMLSFLDARSKRIESGLRDAKKATEKLSEIEAHEKEMLQSARREATELLATARETARQAGEKIILESREESTRILAETQKKIEAERDMLRVEMRKELASLVILATEKVLGETLKDTSDEKIVQRIVKTL